MTARPLRVLIVDDEPPARRKIRRFLDTVDGVAEVFEASDGVRAVDTIRDAEPDVVFLDVQMPGLDGFEVVEALDGNAPQIVFVTAYDEFALRAFDVHAVDYLLKPFDQDRFGRAWTRVRAAVDAEHTREETARLRRLVADIRRERPRALDRILAASGGRSMLVAVSDLLRLQSARNYVRLHTAGGVYLVRSTLARLEERLDPTRFVRINRSEIVNAAAIAELEPAGHGDWNALLSDGTSVRVSRRYRNRLREFEVDEDSET